MARLIRFDRVPRVERGDGIESRPLTPEALDGQEFSMGITTFPPGTSIPLHSHNCIEQVTLLEGEAEVVLDGERHRVEPYDTTQVPAGQLHRFVNVGQGRMRILWVYGSTHVTRTFADGRTVDQFERP